MYIDQISVFVENKKGRLAGIMEVLTTAGIDIRAMTIADTADFGILRMIVDDTDKALEALKADGCTAAVTKVIAFTIPDVSGALYNVMGKINDKQNVFRSGAYCPGRIFVYSRQLCLALRQKLPYKFCISAIDKNI